MNKYQGMAGIMIVLLLLTAFISFKETNAAYTPDLTIVKIAPNNYESFEFYPKYVPGYSVEIANYGSGASNNTTMSFYIRTFENKTIAKSIKVPALNAGKGVRIRFSMSNQTDGSFKEGYAVVNPNKSFKEIKFTNNARKFSLKEVMLSASNKTITEYWETRSSQFVNSSFNYTVSQYSSPISNVTGINKIVCDLKHAIINQDNPEADENYWMYINKVQLKIPAILQNKTKVKFLKSNGASTEKTPGKIIDNETIEANWEAWEAPSYITDIIITITDSNLESKTALREPIRIWRGGTELTTYNRYVSEYYSTEFTNITNYNASYITTSNSYTAHHSNLTGLKVLGNTDGYYTAGWFITPKGNINSAIGLYGNNERQASLISNGQYGLSQKIRDVPSIGFMIKGSDITGFSYFKSLGFRSWTWKETY